MIRTMRFLAVFLGVFFVTATTAAGASAWTGPGSTAPNGNISAPINVGSTAQIKNGDVGVNNFTAFGNELLSGLGAGTGRYLNFDYTVGGTSGSGSAGYGIRDNAGTLEFKNVGGSWASLQSIVSGLAGQFWYMTDTTWIRQYPEDTSHHVYMTGGFDTYSASAVGCSGSLGGGYTFRVCGNAAATAFLYSSDKRLKDNIKPIDDSLWKVLQLSGVSFVWNSGDRKGQHDIGVIAQDVQKVAPEAVQTNPQTGFLSVDYPRLVPILINSIKEQQKMIDSQQKQIDSLSARLEALEAKSN